MSRIISSSSDSDSEAEQPAKKITKYKGSFQYKTKFQNEWLQIFPFISRVKEDVHSYRYDE